MEPTFRKENELIPTYKLNTANWSQIMPLLPAQWDIVLESSEWEDEGDTGNPLVATFADLHILTARESPLDLAS